MTGCLTLLFAVLMLSMATGCVAPGGNCRVDADCESGHVCRSSGGVLFGGGVCVDEEKLEVAIDTGADTPGDVEPEVSKAECQVATEQECEGLDNDGDGVVDDGCPCSFGGSSLGVCADGVLGCSGKCEPPSSYEMDETSCDGVDNDCDGSIDENGLAVDSFALGSRFICVIDSREELYCWGTNGHRQLGSRVDGEQTDEPTEVMPGRAFERVAAGKWHVCAVEEGEGTVCWGEGTSGQLGNGSMERTGVPVRVTGAESYSVLEGGAAHTCGVVDGILYCWGTNAAGQLGIGQASRKNEPVAVAGEGEQVTAVATGALHTCAAGSGDAKCWGDNMSGQLGNGKTGADERTPVLVDSVPDGGFAKLDAGAKHTCGIDRRGRVLCWGSNESGQIGAGDADAGIYNRPTVVDLPKEAESVGAGAKHSCAVLRDGSLYCWGTNNSGVLGLGSSAEIGDVFPSPSRVTPREGVSFNRVEAHGNLTAATTSDGQLFIWGQTDGDFFPDLDSGFVDEPKQRKCL